MTSPEHHDCAVAFCVDEAYFTFSLFMIWQIAHLHPHRRFDFVIATQDDLVIPAWAKPYNIVLHKIGELPPETEAARFYGSMSTVFRIALARELGDRYRRIIYLDSDMYVEGGDLNRLMEIDLGPHPFAAVLDVFFFYEAGHRADEFIRTGLPAMPYFNSGFQVIDTRAYVEQEVERRAIEVCRTHPEAIVLGDQSLLNLALRGKFAELAPCWNWQLGKLFPLLPHNYPVFVHHFIGRKKPNIDGSDPWPVRFNMAYRDFMTLYAPEALARLAPLRDSAPMGFREIARFAVRHAMASHVFEAAISRHTDPYKALL